MSTNHEEYKRKRDEILDQFEIDYADSPFNEKVFDKAAQAIDALVLEVIGKDATPEQQMADNYGIYGAEDRLRYEQRRIVQGDK